MMSAQQHMAEALYHARRAGLHRAQAGGVPARRKRVFLVMSADMNGRAYGHAFRAAELMYDALQPMCAQ